MVGEEEVEEADDAYADVFLAFGLVERVEGIVGWRWSENTAGRIESEGSNVHDRSTEIICLNRRKRLPFLCIVIEGFEDLL